jgi:hypothetical protein
MRNLICKIMGHFWGMTYANLIPPVWATPEEKNIWYTEVCSRKCSVCKKTPLEL